MSGGPVLGKQLAEGGFVAAATWEPLNELSQVSFGVDSVMAGADEQAVNDGAPLTGFRASDEEPVFATDR